MSDYSAISAVSSPLEELVDDAIFKTADSQHQRGRDPSAVSERHFHLAAARWDFRMAGSGLPAVLQGTKRATPTAGLSMLGGGKECRKF